MLKMTWKECHTRQWIADFLEREGEGQVSPVLVIRERRHKMTWSMSKRNGVPVDCKESSEVHRPTRAQQSHAQMRQRTCDRSTDEPAKKEARLFQRDRQWERVSPTGSLSGACCWTGQDTEGCAGTSHGGQSPARRRDTVMVGGIRSISDEQV